MTGEAAAAAHLVEDAAVLIELVELYSTAYGSGLATATLLYEMASGVPHEAARRHAEAMCADWQHEFYRDPVIRAELERAVRAHLTCTPHEPFEIQVAP